MSEHGSTRAQEGIMSTHLINPSSVKAGQRVRIIIDTTVDSVRLYKQEDYPTDVRQRVDILFAKRHTVELPDLTSMGSSGTTIAVLVQP
jgi:hypothetical protein